jgi:hypothetical protein
MSHAAASTKDHAPTSHDTGVAIDWRHTDKRADFTARQLAQLRHLGNQCRTRCFTYAFGAVKQVRQIVELGLDVFGHALLNAHQLLCQRFDNRVQALLGARMGLFQTIAFCAEHGDELAAADDHRCKLLLLGGRKRPNEFVSVGSALQDVTQLCQDACIDTISLGQLPYCSGEVTRLPWFDHRHRIACGLQRARHCRLKAAGGLNDLLEQSYRGFVAPPADSIGRAIPYGVYEVTANFGYVCVGDCLDTLRFAVDAIADWWCGHGCRHYRDAQRLLILADAGGSNSYRSRVWKAQLQELCDACRFPITVCHYPPGCSKWNPIEHRLFSHISLNWAGVPLRSFDTVINYIEGTETITGLKVRADLKRGGYEIGERVSKEKMRSLKIEPHAICPAWSYTIQPRPEPSLNNQFIYC